MNIKVELKIFNIQRLKNATLTYTEANLRTLDVAIIIIGVAFSEHIILLCLVLIAITFPIK